MDFCKYHPLDGATHICRQCHIHQCDKCIDMSNSDARCFLCGNVLESLGAANTVEPFWRRLPEAFKYPLNASSMSLIVATSVISVLATLMPFLLILSLLMYLFAAGSILKYSFSCLERTALGEMKAPDVMDAYQGGIKLLFQLVLITIILSAVVGIAGYYLGNAIGGFLLVVIVVSFPAILIRFAQTENMLEAMNPLHALGLIAAIGLPYGLLIAFILIMMSSVGVLHQLIGQMFPAISYLLQSVISNYYTVVLFHLMGYMLFQYQGQLGYIAEEVDERPLTSEAEQLAAKIDVFLKEGDYEQVVKLYYHAFKHYPAEANFFERYFELLYACKKTALMMDYGTDYLLFLIKKKRFDKITLAYKQILMIAPEFVPVLPEVRVQLAGLLKQQGDVKRTIKLLNGMHKLYPDFAGLADAYQLLADALDDMPGMQAQATKCREWIVQFKHKAVEKAVQAERDAEQLALARTTSDPLVVNEAKMRKPNPAMKSSGVILELVPMASESQNA
jgi:tetratricopeptide (TPR) repeat protein